MHFSYICRFFLIWTIQKVCMSFWQSLMLCPFCRDLDQASMEAVVSLLAGLPLQPEEGDGVELMEAKSQLFLKYGASPKDFPTFRMMLF